ncbi:Peptidase A1 [Corchorus capsularis]|uniref:Peptidase A1 n=1 Tax=Corchorus capsularis TaxID=210143 RepID=A0A1R3GU40_COCAP|nr:Peptidase A1 [Corchorus capsularis]
MGGTCAPSSQKKSSANVFLQDELRVTGIGNGAKDSILYQSMSAGLYTVTVGFGSPVKNYKLILDTGSSITWEGDPTIIGNHQLQNLNVLYDIQNQRIGIGPGNC